jgi:serine phosphatase RsbU (regulator of sigma subunit)/CHASE3 domain sensor protein
MAGGTAPSDTATRRGHQTLRRRVIKLGTLALALMVGTIGIGLALDIAAAVNGFHANAQIIVLNAEQELLTGMLDQEVGVFGYASTGRPELLQPYQPGRTRADQSLRQLERGLAGGPHGPLLARVLADVRAWEGWAEATRQGVAGPTSVASPEILNEGRDLFARFRTGDTALHRALAADLDRSAANATRAGVVSGVGTGIGLSLTSVLVVVLVARIVRLALGPVVRLAATARRIAAGAQVDIPYRDGEDEIAELARALAAWQDAAAERAVLLMEDITARRQQMEQAARIQRQLLPQTAPQLDGYDLAGTCLPAQDVAGDFYDWTAGAGGYLDLTLADVMGKGIGPALVMATLHALLRAAPPRLSPSERVAFVARLLPLALLQDGLFVTLFHGRVDLRSGTLRYVDAGHGYCAVRRAGGEVEALGDHSLPLGVVPDQAFAEGTVRLAPGDMLVVHSDGLVETGSGTIRTGELAPELAGAAGSSEAVERLVRRLPRQPDDDVTVIVLHRQ